MTAAEHVWNSDFRHSKVGVPETGINEVSVDHSFLFSLSERSSNLMTLKFRHSNKWRKMAICFVNLSEFRRWNK